MDQVGQRGESLIRRLSCRCGGPFGALSPPILASSSNAFELDLAKGLIREILGLREDGPDPELLAELAEQPLSGEDFQRVLRPVLVEAVRADPQAVGNVIGRTSSGSGCRLLAAGLIADLESKSRSRLLAESLRVGTPESRWKGSGSSLMLWKAPRRKRTATSGLSNYLERSAAPLEVTQEINQIEAWLLIIRGTRNRAWGAPRCGARLAEGRSRSIRWHRQAQWSDSDLSNRLGFRWC